MSRADRLVELLDERELDCLLVTDLVNVRYLAGFTGSNGACVVGRDERLFFTDFRYVEQSGAEVRDFEVVQAGREKLGAGVELVPAGGLVERLRAVKDASEVAAMRAAAELADAAYGSLRERGLAGRTEREVALQLVRFMEDEGAEGPSFPPIVASGGHGAHPHAVPREVQIP